MLANAEMRFLWLGLATAVLIGVVIACRRSLNREQEQQRLAGAHDREPADVAGGERR